MRAALYLRHATDDPRSIQVQLETARRYAAEHGIQWVDTYIDPAVTGLTPFAARPEGARLLADARANRIDVVYVTDLHRIARDVTLARQALQDLERAGCHVETMAPWTGPDGTRETVS